MLESLAAERFVEAGDVARDPWPDVGVETGRREALELAVQRKDLVRDREVGLRKFLGHDLANASLMTRVEVGMEKADGDGLDARVTQLTNSNAHLVLVKRLEYLAVGDNHALLDGVPVAPLRQRP